MNNPKQPQFQAAMATALADRDAARDEIFAQLQQLSPEERAKVAPETFASLTPMQFATLLGRPLPKMSPEMALADFKPDPDTWPHRRPGWRFPFAGNGAIKICSPLHRALQLAGMVWLCTGLASVGAVWAAPYAASLVPPPIRQANVSTWPQCAHLAPNTDGCVYYVESAMTWSEAAQSLGMKLPTLLAANKSTGIHTLIAGSPIIVWRFRRSLSN